MEMHKRAYRRFVLLFRVAAVIKIFFMGFLGPHPPRAWMGNFSAEKIGSILHEQMSSTHAKRIDMEHFHIGQNRGIWPGDPKS